MKKYNYFHYPQNKKDFYQLQYLYTNGGMYIDLDQEQIVQLEDVVLDATFISMVPLGKESGLCIGFMGATKYNPIVKDIFNTILCILLEIHKRKYRFYG
jgi:mannosyltransferase OCH1-like enzyme